MGSSPCSFLKEWNPAETIEVFTIQVQSNGTDIVETIRQDQP